MPIEVELDDQILEFPDDMSDDDIKSVLREKFPSPTRSEDPLLESAAALNIPEDFLSQGPPVDRVTSGGPQIRIPGDLSFGRDVLQGVIETPDAASQLSEKLVQPLLPQDMAARESVFGLTPDVVPTGARISEATGLPRALTVPASGAGRALAGLGEFLTSPAGVADIGVAAIPGIGLAQRAKFIKDMAEGAGQSAGRLAALAEKAVSDPRSVTEEDSQAMAEDTANTALMLFGAGKLTSSQFAELTGIRAPLGRMVESTRTRFAKDLAAQLKKSQPLVEPSAPSPIRQLGIQQSPLTAEPFLQPGVRDFAGEAIREAQGPRIEVPGELSALERLRREVEPPIIEQVEPTRLAERVEGGGEAPYGKVSYQRAAEAPTIRTGEMAKIIDEIRDLERQKVLDPELRTEVKQQRIQDRIDDRMRKLFKLRESDALIEQARAERAAPAVREMRPVEPGRGEEINAPSIEDVRAQRALEQRQAEAASEGEVLKPQKGERLVELVSPDGTTEIVAFGDKYWDWPGQGKRPSIARWTGDGWSHGAAKPGQTIREISRTAEESKPSPEPTVESVTALDPQSGSPLSATESLVNRLEALKFGGQSLSPRLYTLRPDMLQKVGKQLWDDAIDLAIAGVKAGKAIGEAINDAIAHIKRNRSGLDVDSIRSELEKIVRTESTPKPTTQAGSTAKAAAPATPRGATLDDIYKIFEPAPKATPGLKETVVKAINAFRAGFSSRFRPIDKLAEDIAKEYGIASKKGIAGIFEQLKGSSGKAEADIYRFDRAVSNKVRGSEKDFSAYLFLRRSLDRLNQDIADAAAGKPSRRKVSTYTIPELESKLATLEAKLEPERLKSFQEAADLYQQHMDASLRLQVDSGRMSNEIYDSIKEGNAFYAPFKVLKYFEEGVKPEGSGRKVDTLADFTKAMEGIESPDFKLGDMLGAARQNIALSRILAEKNNTMRRFAELADQDVNNVFTQKLKPGQDAPIGMEVVNVLRNGKQERYAVNSDVAQAVQLFGDTANTFGARVLQMASVPFRAGATALNIPFQFSNLLADAPRAALVSKYGIRGVTDLIRYPVDMIDALFSSMLGNVVGYKNKLFMDFLDSGAAGTTIQEYLTPQGLKFQRTSIPETIAKKALYTLPDFAQAIEQMSKVLGVKRAMRFTGTESGKELAAKIPEAITEIRRFSGSPDFGRQGRWVEEARLNLLYMFLNARIQGVTADLGRLTGRDGAKQAASMWGKMGLAVGIPTAYLYSLNRSAEYADDYDKRPKQEKENYWLIPKDTFITNDQGEKMRDYWRIPKRESAKWIANSLEAAMDFAEKKDVATFANWAETMVEEITPVNIQGDTLPQRLESMAASLNPIIKAPLEMATGRDMYRHRDIVPDQMQKASPSEQYTDRTAEVFKSLAAKMPDVLPEVFHSPIMLESMVRNLSAGLITQFLPKRPIEGRGPVENAPLLQRFQALPYTDQEKFKEEMQQLEREAADEQVRRYRNANNFVRENKSLSIEEKARKAAQAYKGDARQVERIIDLLIAERNGITSQERQILALPVVQRAQYISEQIAGMSKGEKTRAMREYARKRILTEGVAEELVKLLSQ